jgi:hypothetical protein
MTTGRALAWYWFASVALPIGEALGGAAGLRSWPVTEMAAFLTVSLRTFFLIVITVKVLRNPALQDFLHR